MAETTWYQSPVSDVTT